jgi:tetratricopeptide (TPR) repeat protein
LGRYSEATESLTHEALTDNDEAIFWRASVRATSGDLAGAAMDLRRTGPIVRDYPKNLKTPMGTLVTKSVLEIGDVKQARHWLEILRLDDLTAAGESQLDLEEGRVLELTGDFDGAIKIWEKVKEGNHRPSQGKAIVARMELLLKLGRADRKEAIEDLEGLRFKWRGDEFEFNMLRRLGSLYLEEGLYREGLDRLRQAATHYRTHEEAPQVTQKMSDAFNSLFLDEGADALPPINTISIYDEFKELTPAGAQGDEMIRKLADRLVGVDLLGRAATLLSSQVRFRLKGLEKARVGTQLALVRVLDRDYEPALRALDETVQPNLPEPLITQRRHIRAKSLLGLDRQEQAMAVLKDDKSHDAELIRTEAFWGTQDWSAASRALRRLIRLTGAKPGGTLDQRQASFVLNYAITLTLSGNERALRRLHSDFGGAMGQTNLKEAFQLIVTPPTLGLFDPAKVAAGVKEVENFQSFMSAYRERLKKQSLSELVPGSKPTDEKEPENKKPEGEAPEATQPPVQPPARAIPQAEAQPQSPAKS